MSCWTNLVLKNVICSGEALRVKIANLFYATVRSDILGGDYDHIKNEEERKKYVHFLTLMESNAIGKTIVDLSKE